MNITPWRRTLMTVVTYAAADVDGKSLGVVIWCCPNATFKEVMLLSRGLDT